MESACIFACHCLLVFTMFDWNSLPSQANARWKRNLSVQLDGCEGKCMQKLSRYETFLRNLPLCVWTPTGRRQVLWRTVCKKTHSNTPLADDWRRVMAIVRAAVLVMNSPMNSRRGPPREMRDDHLRLAKQSFNSLTFIVQLICVIIISLVCRVVDK
jgi:hypothetical protein